MVAEGSQALMEAHVPQPIISAHLLRIPSLVIAGGDDPLVGYATTLRTAAYHGAHHICARDAGHLLPIEPGADWTASRVLEWIEQKGL
jgi:pimeloyl-ACP methyl ester carboxylesterase